MTTHLKPGLKLRYVGPVIDTVAQGQVLTFKALGAAFGNRTGKWFTFVSFEETDQELSLNTLEPTSQ